MLAKNKAFDVETSYSSSHFQYLLVTLLNPAEDNSSLQSCWMVESIACSSMPCISPPPGAGTVTCFMKVKV